MMFQKDSKTFKVNHSQDTRIKKNQRVQEPSSPQPKRKKNSNSTMFANNLNHHSNNHASLNVLLKFAQKYIKLPACQSTFAQSDL